MVTGTATSGGYLSRNLRWFFGVPPTDPVERRHAPSLIVLCGLGTVALVVGELLRWRAGLVTQDLAVSCLRLLGAAVLAAAFLVIRNGHFRRGASLFVAGAVFIIAAGIALTGFAANSGNLTELVLPLALAALLISRRALWLSMAAYALGFWIGGLRDAGQLWGHGPNPPPALPFGAVGTAIIGFTVVSIVLDRVGHSLREGFELAIARQRELERAGAELESANTALQAEMARRQAAEAHLIEAQKMEAVSRLSGGVAHDFNNLLTVIMGNAELARDSLPVQHDAQEGLVGIQEAAERAADLTRQLLAFARRQLVEPKVVPVDEHARATQKLLARLLREDIHLKTDFAAGDGCVLIDPGQLGQVLVNFAVNARDAMPVGGTLSIRTRAVALPQGKASALFSIPAGDYVMIEVADTGVGMDEVTCRRIFEPFFTTKGETKGTGLGLATCYGIVLEARGGIFVETLPGRGTTFSVYLPSADPAKVSRPTPTGGVVAHGARGETILVVEDEERVREVSIGILKREGYHVLEAAGVVQAAEVARTAARAIDLLLTDMVLEDGTGAEVVARVLALRPGIRVLYTSGHTDDEALRRGIFENEIEFLNKPFSASRLAVRVREVLDRPVKRSADARVGQA